MSVRAWIADKIRRRSRSDETFKTSSVISRLEAEGFKPLIKSDVLDARTKRIKEELDAILQILSGPYSAKNKGLAVDAVYTLMMTTASPWLRSMDNPWLAGKVNDFIELYDEFRNIPEYLGMLVTCASAIINLSMTNIDIEPLTPIIISPGTMRETRVIQEGEERHSSKHESEVEE